MVGTIPHSQEVDTRASWSLSTCKQHKPQRAKHRLQLPGCRALPISLKRAESDCEEAVGFDLFCRPFPRLSFPSEIYLQAGWCDYWLRPELYRQTRGLPLF